MCKCEVACLSWKFTGNPPLMLCLVSSILLSQATPWIIIGRHRVYVLQIAHFFVIGPAINQLLLIKCNGMHSAGMCTVQGSVLRFRLSTTELHITVQ